MMSLLIIAGCMIGIAAIVIIYDALQTPSEIMGEYRSADIQRIADKYNKIVVGKRWHIEETAVSGVGSEGVGDWLRHAKYDVETLLRYIRELETNVDDDQLEYPSNKSDTEEATDGARND